MNTDLKKSIYPDVTGVLLAGGRSKRMGQDKAMLEIAGRPLYRRVIDLMRGLFDQVLISGERPDLELPGIKSYPDIYPGSSLAGVHTALKAAETDWIFIAPCDMPFPDRLIFEKLLPLRSDVSAVLPTTDGRVDAVFGLYNKSCLPIIEEMLIAENFRIQSLFARIDCRLIDTAEFPEGWQLALSNVNTPEDLEKVLAEKR